MTFNDTAFNTGAPLTLAPGASFTGNFFDMLAAALTPAGGPFSATFLVQVTDQSGNPFDIQEGFFFSVQQGGGTVIPEPATMVLLGSGLAGLAAARRQRRKQQ